jgi:endonuclease YncB( thermonuclease family)
MPRTFVLLTISSAALAIGIAAGRASVQVPERRLMQERPSHRETIIPYWPVETVDDHGMLQIMYAPERMQPETVGLRGIYLPQPGEPQHDAALASLIGMVEGSAVALDFGGTQVKRDGAGRLLVFAWADSGGTEFCLNVELVRLGLARVVPGDAGALSEELQAAEQKAREAKRGLWAQEPSPRQGG